MKTPPVFKGRWLAFAIVAGILTAEWIAWQLANSYELHLNYLTVAFGAAGIVGMLASVICKDWRAE